MKRMTVGKDETHKKTAPALFCTSNISGTEQVRSQIEIQLEGICTQAVII